ncbi:hypothetical protein [Vibrio owensii]|uniref:hypothetical protein n=1 Tax=Vibrio owensii TaxID=696485 RepID=UPI000596C395|nr:hypothetical protein [Vibrio owensii]
MIQNASNEILQSQSMENATTYLTKAKAEIDDLFGKGYAKANPQLVAAYLTAASNEFLTTLKIKYSQS